MQLCQDPLQLDRSYRAHLSVQTGASHNGHTAHGNRPEMCVN